MKLKGVEGLYCHNCKSLLHRKRIGKMFCHICDQQYDLGTFKLDSQLSCLEESSFDGKEKNPEQYSLN
jgi:uncharacterized Zn finger protein (UPF0148 family)